MPVRAIASFRGSSPHTRGARRPLGPRPFAFGIIPAYAGSTDDSSLAGFRTADHPRIRGEHANTMPVTIRHFGSSPHTRGAHAKSRWLSPSIRIIPAYAGSTSPAPAPSSAPSDHPRIRGEHAQRHNPKGDFTGSSPHTRGARPGSSIAAAGWRIIPAYAGSTCTSTRPSRASTDHPRIRGEHIQKQSADSTGKGSSPHTRGAPGMGSWLRRRPRIIPAYAGSTRCGIRGRCR